MLSFLKEKKLKKELELYNFNKEFDLKASENYQIDSKETSPLLRNTYVFTASSFEKKQTLYFKLTVTPLQTEAYIFVTDGFNKYVLDQQIYTSTCPLKIFKDEDDKWNVTFNNYLKKNNKDNAKFSFTSKFECCEEAIDKRTYLTKELLLNSLKKEKNYKEKIEEIKNDTVVSYYQQGSLKGRMILEGQSSNFEFNCIKIHSYGEIDYTKINNHADLTIFDKGLFFNLNLISQKNIDIYENGVYCENNSIQYIKKAEYERQMFTRGIAPSNLNILLKLQNTQDLSLHIKKIEEVDINLQEGEYKLIISVIEILMEGKKYRGIMECGFNNQKDRWFNGQDIL